MKKRLLGVFLALTLALTCFAVAACGKEEEKDTPIGDPVAMSLAYAEDTGVLSWAAVDGATKYTVRLSNVNDTAKSEQTSETSVQLYLRSGLTRITVVAEDDKGRERGNGVKTVTLDVDFGAPDSVTGISYDKASGSLGWTASEGAVKYYVSISSVNNAEFAAIENREVTDAALTVALDKGVYDVSVVAADEHDAKSAVSAYRYASYVDPTYDSEISEGVYKLFDFGDENVLDLSRYNAEYKSWSQESIKPEWAITNSHEKAEGTSEADTVEFESNALKVRAAYNDEEDNVARTGAITFTLPEPLENWGRIYYDMFRTQNPPAGIMLTDTFGRQYLKNVEYSHGDTLGKWGTVSFIKSEVLAANPDFGAIGEISFVLVNMKGGVAYFDNVRYDLVDLGYFGDCLYKRSTDTFTFDAVSGAQKYKMYVDGATDPIELTDPEYAFETPLATGNHSIRIVAFNGDSQREHTYDFAVGDKIRFNTEITENSGEYVLADFETVEYREYFATTARDWANRYYRYAIEDGKLNITHNEDWGNGYLDFAFPTEITDAKVIYFTGVTTSNPYWFGIMYKNAIKTDSDGNPVYTESIYSSANASSGTLAYTVPEAQKDNPIVGIRIYSCYEGDATGVAKTISIDSIIYLANNGVGYLGENCKYVRSSDLFTFGEAFNAESYELYVDDSETPLTTDAASYDFSASPLAKGNHTIRVKAINGNKFREHTYTFTLDEKAKFNVETASGSGEYILADFNTTAYDEYLSVAGDHASWGATKYSVKDGNLVIDPLCEQGYNQTVKYTFPTAINKSDILYIKVKFTATNVIKMYAFDESGNMTSDIWLGAPTAMTTVNFSAFTSLPGNKVTAIAFTLHNWNNQAVVNVDEITYEKLEPITNFNTKVDGTDYDYMLADFNVNEYRRQLSLAGSQFDWGGQQSTYTLADGKVNVVSKRSWENSYIKYTFSTALDKNTVGAIKFKYTVESEKNALLYAFDENGNNCYVLGGSSTTEATITANQIGALAGTKIVAIAISSREANASDVFVNVSVDEITYEKLEPITNFNTLVEGTENEYLLADFSVSGYKQNLSTKGTGKYQLVSGGLAVTGASWNNNGVVFTLPTAIPVSEIAEIKVDFTVGGGKHGVFRVSSNGTDFVGGTNNGVSPISWTVDTGVLTGDNLTTILLSCNDTATTITYTKITYTKKTA